MKKFLYRILFLFSGILIAEFFLLFFSPIFPLPTDSLINKSGDTVYKMSKEFHHDYRPSQEFIRYPTNLDEFKPVHNKINSLGIRGEEISTKKSTRILLLGDSFIEAEEVDEKLTLGRHLKQKLGGEFDVIQKGSSSWSPLLELNWLLKLGFSLEPDHIVLFLVPNDFWGSQYPRSDLSYNKTATFNKQGDPLAFDVKRTNDRSLLERQFNKLQSYKLAKNAYVSFMGLNEKFNFRSTPDFAQFTQKELDELLAVHNNEIRKILDQRFPDYNPVKNQVVESICLARRNELWDDETKSNVELSMKFLQRIKSHCSERNIKLSILLVPFGWNIDLKETKLARRHFHMENAVLPLGGIETEIKEFCSANEVEYHNLVSFFQNLNSQKLLYYRSDPHWGPHGHKAVAEFLYSKLKVDKNG